MLPDCDGILQAMKILLISSNTLTVPYPVYPIGLDYVAGAIGDGHQVRISDMLTTSMEELAEIIDDYHPDIIGISCRNIDNTDCGDPLYLLEDAKALVAWLRERSPAVIVCGGSGFTIMPERVLAELGADYGVIGEGERLPLLLDALAAGGDPTAIPGILSAAKSSGRPLPWSGRQVRRPPSAAHSRYYIQNGGMLNLQTKRGCSFRCLYCSYPQIEGGTHRLTDPEEVAQTALGLQKIGAKYLFFTDSAFNSDIRHSLEVAKALQQARLSIPWGAFFAPIAAPEDYYALMAKAGCRHVEFGTESLSDTMLKALRKPFRAADVRKAHRQVGRARIHVAHYLLFGGPQESAETVNETLDAIEQLERSVFFLFTGIRIYPETPLYDMAVAEGKITGETDLLRPVFYQPDDIDLGQIEAIIRKRAAGRSNWVTGSGGQHIADTVRNLHGHGFAGPLWEFAAA
jgi:radical SAM superfamily enzyme YgiQ (UPF0313 family)